MRYYVVTDVHGFYNEMFKALTEQGYFTDKQPHKLIICGDLFDRGTQNKEVEEFVLGLLEKDEVILIRGNHEDLLVECIEKLSLYALFGNHSHHYTNGTINTIDAQKDFPHDVSDFHYLLTFFTIRNMELMNKEISKITIPIAIEYP